MKITIIGLGYVRLPLAIEISKEYQVVITEKRIIFDLQNMLDIPFINYRL